MSKVSQQEINDILWKACDTFRGTIDATDYKNYILTMLFVKYISDVWEDHAEAYRKQFGEDEERIRRRMERERFVLPEGCSFDELYKRREAANVGELINIALEKIELANKAKLTNVFRNIDYNSESMLGNTNKRNRILKHLLEDFADKRLDLRPSRIGNLDVIGNAYEYLIGKFAADAGKKAGEFYTPPRFQPSSPNCCRRSPASASVIPHAAPAHCSSSAPTRSAVTTTRSLGRKQTAAPGRCAR